MAITGASHVESATGSGAVSVVTTCKRMGESHGIRCRKWSRIVAIIRACQGVMEPRRIHRRRWNRMWPLLWPARGSRSIGRSSARVSGGERWLATHLRGAWSLALQEPGRSLLSVEVGDEVRLPQELEWSFPTAGARDERSLAPTGVRAKSTCN